MTEFLIKIVLWEKQFNLYLNKEVECTNALSSILIIKNTLTSLIGNQRIDDIIFYKSIINSSYFYLSESLKKRKLKMINDLNYIWAKIDSKKSLNELNKGNFASLLKDFKKLIDDVIIARKHNTVLAWVKDDTIMSLLDIETEINNILNYHLRIITSFCISIKNEELFYCSNKNMGQYEDNLKKINAKLPPKPTLPKDENILLPPAKPDTNQPIETEDIKYQITDDNELPNPTQHIEMTNENIVIPDNMVVNPDNIDTPNDSIKPKKTRKKKTPQ